MVNKIKDYYSDSRMKLLNLIINQFIDWPTIDQVSSQMSSQIKKLLMKKKGQNSLRR
jgi:hypothetical protein